MRSTPRPDVPDYVLPSQLPAWLDGWETGYRVALKSVTTEQLELSIEERGYE